MTDHTRNRMGNSKNPFQGTYKKVLCVCSAGLLRSPTTALVLSQEPYYYNTRAAGVTPEYALIPVDETLIYWSDEIVVMEPWMGKHIQEMFNPDVPIVSLGIQDSFSYRDEDLIQLIKDRYNAYLK